MMATTISQRTAGDAREHLHCLIDARMKRRLKSAAAADGLTMGVFLERALGSAMDRVLDDPKRGTATQK